MQSRFYSPDLRRFINADLLHGDITNSLTLNRYAYCNGDPVNGIDPLGLSQERGDGTYFTAYDPNIHYYTLDEYLERTYKLPKARVYSDSSNKSHEYDIWKEFINDDGSISLHDNRRFDSDAVFHEQLLSFKGNHGLSIPEGILGFDYSLTLINGGWELENIDLSLFDFGKVSAGAGVVDDFIGLSLKATAYAPSVTFPIFGYDVTIEIDIGSIGGEIVHKNGVFKASGAYGVGAGISIAKSDD